MRDGLRSDAHELGRRRTSRVVRNRRARARPPAHHRRGGDADGDPWQSTAAAAAPPTRSAVPVHERQQRVALLWAGEGRPAPGPAKIASSDSTPRAAASAKSTTSPTDVELKQQQQQQQQQQHGSSSDHGDRGGVFKTLWAHYRLPLLLGVGLAAQHCAMFYGVRHWRDRSRSRAVDSDARRVATARCRL